jgi:membrane peptidoglycan carboxypeptidase
LGAVEISLLDASVMLDGIVTGQRDYVEEATQKGTVLIKEIIGPGGEVLYKAQPKKQQVSNFVTGILVSDILHNIVEHGTGRRAKGYKTKAGISVPLLGKTGTTNGFKNAAFVGVVPRADAGSWNPQEGVIISTYVGYDMPKSMMYKRTKLSGSSGALPVWLQTVKGVELSGLLGHPHKEMVWEPSTETGFYAKNVNAETGIVEEEGTSKVWIYDPNALWGKETSHQRAFSPVGIGDVPKWKPLHALESEDVIEEDAQIRIAPQEDSAVLIEPRLKRETEVKDE